MLINHLNIEYSSELNIKIYSRIYLHYFAGSQTKIIPNEKSNNNTAADSSAEDDSDDDEEQKETHDEVSAFNEQTKASYYRLSLLSRKRIAQGDHQMTIKTR